MDVWVVEGMEATSSDILGAYDTEEKAQQKVEIEENLRHYCSVVVHKLKLNAF